jgi:hypothetical protein
MEVHDDFVYSFCLPQYSIGQYWYGNFTCLPYSSLGTALGYSLNIINLLFHPVLLSLVPLLAFSYFFVKESIHSFFPNGSSIIRFPILLLLF